VNLWIFVGAAALLSLERICYLRIWRAPDEFRAACARPWLAWMGGPVEVLRQFFCGFKLLQCAVFLTWCFIYGDGSLQPANGSAWFLGLAAIMIASGQALNLAVFYRLGKIGVFYGNKFGHKIAWSRKFPFSCLKHPQYLGALLSIWGFFLFMRYPDDDWYWLPVLETVYYAVGAYFER
jgi:methylene-fatty-acyl-phospholipid synthase